MITYIRPACERNDCSRNDRDDPCPLGPWLGDHCDRSQVLTAPRKYWFMVSWHGKARFMMRGGLGEFRKRWRCAREEEQRILQVQWLWLISFPGTPEMMVGAYHSRYLHPQSSVTFSTPWHERRFELRGVHHNPSVLPSLHLSHLLTNHPNGSSLLYLIDRFGQQQYKHGCFTLTASTCAPERRYCESSPSPSFQP